MALRDRAAGRHSCGPEAGNPAAPPPPNATGVLLCRWRGWSASTMPRVLRPSGKAILVIHGCMLPVIGQTMTRMERTFIICVEMTMTGRAPACSLPLTGSRFAKYMSPADGDGSVITVKAFRADVGTPIDSIRLIFPTQRSISATSSASGGASSSLAFRASPCRCRLGCQ